jgi:hypothetical protein
LRLDTIAENGEFSFDSVPKGTYSVAAYLPGLSAAWREGLSENQEGVEIRLRELGTLWLRVVNENDYPVTHYTLRIAAEGWNRRILPDQAEYEVQVENPEGLHESQVMAGPYKVKVFADGYRPGGPEKAIRVEPGQRPPEPVTIQLAGGVTLEGQVTDGWNGVPGAQVCWYFGHVPRRGTFQIPDPTALTNPGGCATTDGIGWFVLDNLPPEEVTLICRSEGFAPWMDNTLDMRHPPGQMEIILERGVRVSGTVYHKGNTFPDATVSLQPEDQVESVPPDWNCTTDASGRFQFDYVPPGSYRAMVTRYYRGSILSRGYMIQVPEEDAVFNLTIPGGEMYVRVTDSSTQALLKVGPVKLIPAQTDHVWQGLHLVLPPTLTLNNTDSDGNFVFVGLPPGEYQLIATPAHYTPTEITVSLGFDEIGAEYLEVTPEP